MRGLTVRQRIENKTDMSAGPDACWPWVGGKGNSGTATMQIDKRARSVRRVLWELEFGPVPDQNVVSDACGNRGCMNPKHLRLRSFVLAERFWSFVDKSGGDDACWPYTRYCHGWGYGSFPIGEKGKYPSNRVAWELTNGPIPDGLHVLHMCDNPPCCNPKHLRLGTHQENMADCIAKGRNSKGPEHVEKMKRARQARENMKRLCEQAMSSDKRSVDNGR
jgi:hypothetical protein